MNTKSREFKKKLYLVLVLMVCIIGVGFALLFESFKITGLAKINSGKWSIYFDNIRETVGSVSLDDDNKAKIILPDKDTIIFTVSFSKLGEFYEFSVDIVNEGTIDAMIESMVNTYPLTDDEKRFLEFSVRYDNGVEIKVNDILEHETTQTIKIRLTFVEDLIASDLANIPDSGFTKTIEFKINYLQADETATTVSDLSFGNLDWRTIATLVRSGSHPFNVGDEKEIDMGKFGKHVVRVANISTPEKCSKSWASQTACGFVVEFKDIIVKHHMNPQEYFNGEYYSYGWTTGGYVESEMYDYLQNDVFNALPSDLRDTIVKTRVVSGKGLDDDGNIISFDKLYFLSNIEVHETGEGSKYDTSSGASRQLDYYEKIGVTEDNCAGAIKYYNGVADYWWMRSSRNYSNSTFSCVNEEGYRHSCMAFKVEGISPAFKVG